VGDIAYADYWLKEEQQGYITPLNTTDHGKEYDKILNEFYGEIAEVSQDRPYMVGVGKFPHRCN
jgi:acid phosphatase type 7